LSYQNNRDKVLDRQSARRIERINFINDIALRYGCRNPNCGWKGDFIGSQLDFHHYDPSQKITAVAKTSSWAYEKIIEEINKCIVLCKNCHALVHAGAFVVNESMICKVESNFVGKQNEQKCSLSHS
jgi:hypothetical protein